MQLAGTVQKKMGHREAVMAVGEWLGSLCGNAGLGSDLAAVVVERSI